MESRKPVAIEEMQVFYNPIAKYIESTTGVETQIVINDWCPELYKDIGKETEALMLMYGQGVSDRFLYGFYAGIVAMRHENDDSLPDLNAELYNAVKDAQDLIQSEQGKQAIEYFGKLEDNFYERFPLTATLLAHLKFDLRTRLGVPQKDIDEGFTIGWYKALKVVMPLFDKEA